MNGISEAMKGFSDLPIAAICLIFGFLAWRGAKKHAVLFFEIAAAAVIGAAVHIFQMPVPVRDAVWIVLYPVLFELVRRFACLFSGYIAGRETPDGRAVFLTEGALCLLSVGFMLFVRKYDMYFFIAFGAFCAVRIIRTVLSARRLPTKAGIILAAVPVILLLQGFSTRIPYAVVYEHVIIAGLLVVFFLIAKEEKKDS